MDRSARMAYDPTESILFRWNRETCGQLELMHRIKIRLTIVLVSRQNL